MRSPDQAYHCVLAKRHGAETCDRPCPLSLSWIPIQEAALPSQFRLESQHSAKGSGRSVGGVTQTKGGASVSRTRIPDTQTHSHTDIHTHTEGGGKNRTSSWKERDSGTSFASTMTTRVNPNEAA